MCSACHARGQGSIPGDSGGFSTCLVFLFFVNNIGIKHDFPFINIRKVPREVSKAEGPPGGVENLGLRLQLSTPPEGPCEC